jgi:MscS family membrane protein
MKWKFETVFRWYVVALVITLLWAVWADAQTNLAATNTTAAADKAAGNGLAFSKGWLTFGLDQVDALNLPVFGRPAWQYLASLIYIALAFYISKFLDFFISNRLKVWAKKTETKLDDLLLELLRGPVKVVSFVILLHIGLQVFSWPQWIEDLLSKGLYIVVAISITYMAVKCVDLLVTHWRERTLSEGDQSVDELLVPIIRKSIKVFVVLVAALVTTQNLGLNITGVLASLSIGGLAIGLAAQDTLGNLFGGVAVLVDKPFRVGDRIRLNAVDGNVETIGVRSTRIRSLDGFLVIIPNKTVGNATITNITRRHAIRTEMNLGLVYSTSNAKLREALDILETIFRGHPKTNDLAIAFNKFGDFALNINVVHWYGTTDNKEYLQGIQELNLAVKERFEQAGLEFAFPTQTIHLPKQEGEPNPKQS